MQTGKCAKIHESSFRPNPYQLFSHFKYRWAISHWVPAVSIRNDHITNLWRLPDSLTIREQRILMEQVSLCIYYMLITVSCLHCTDAIFKHNFSVNHICEQHMRIIIYLRSLISPLLFAVERPLPFINCFCSNPHWPRSARCDGVCLNICLLWISNRHIWNANSKGSGQTALCNLTRTFALNGLT